MSSWGGICTCGAGCKRETGCRGFGREHEMEMTTSATIISGLAPAAMHSDSKATNKSSGVEEVPDYKCAKCNGDPCSY